MMKNAKFAFYATSLLAVFFEGSLSLAATHYAEVDHSLEIFTSSPPALMFVQDSNGNVTGAYPAGAMTPFGRDSIIQNIPSSYTDADNLVSDDPASVGESNHTTGWSVNILDEPVGDYVINLIGIQNGISQIFVAGSYVPQDHIPTVRSIINIFVSRSVTRTIQVSFDPTLRSMTITPQVSGSDLFQDTQSACALGDIRPAQACAALEKITSEVEQALAKGDGRRERAKLDLYLGVLNRLRHWGKEGEQEHWDDMKANQECAPLWGNTWNGKRASVDKQAFAALELDAKTLLADLPVSKNDDKKKDGNR